MERVRIDGAVLEVEVQGDGEPVLLVHGSNFSSMFRPMVGEKALAGYRLIRYNRRGHGESSPVPDGFTVDEQAADAAALLHVLGIDPVHVVGHSYGGAIALQLAIDAPDLVHTLSLLEPPVPAIAPALEFEQLVEPIRARWEAGDGDAAYNDLLVAVGGPHYRMAVDLLLPGANELALAGLRGFFAAELPSLGRWRPTAHDVGAISRPTLLVVGSKTGSWFEEGHAILQEWLPHSDTAVIEGATHLLEVTHPRPSRKRWPGSSPESTVLTGQVLEGGGRGGGASGSSERVAEPFRRLPVLRVFEDRGNRLRKLLRPDS